jgi:membrane-associated phospholipid phosphatase
VRWNEATLAAVKADRTPPPVAARNLAIVQGAMYDAVAIAGGRYQPFYANLRAPVGVDPEAAAAVAAHRTLAGLYPGRMNDLDAALDETLNHIPEGPAKSSGIALGQTVAEQYLRWRAGDGMSAARHNYRSRLEVGRWRPTPSDYGRPLLPGWGNVPCFAVADPASFRPPGPPGLDSEAYAASFRTVWALGSAASTARTREQTEVAFFWADGEGTVTPPGHWNRIAQSLARSRKLDLTESARLFALLNVAMADAGCICWDCKYRFDFWRPVTAIREVDPRWTPLLPTPPFPAYTSGHSSFSGAAASALAAYFGTDRVQFSSTSEGLPGVTRSFDSFSAAAEEAGMSRIYGGIHWSFDNVEGLASGRQVAEHVARHHFRPVAARNRDGVPATFPVLRRER